VALVLVVFDSAQPLLSSITCKCLSATQREERVAER
jgi:hypothetical protein